MSKYADQITDVVKELKIEILRLLDNNVEVSIDDVDRITRGVFKKCAMTFNVQETTIADKCTRRMNINTAEFYDLVKKYILKQSDTLEEKFVTYMPDDENEFSIRNALQQARDKS